MKRKVKLIGEKIITALILMVCIISISGLTYALVNKEHYIVTGPEDIDGAIYTNSGMAETFRQYKSPTEVAGQEQQTQISAGDCVGEIPTWLFADNWISLWCSAHGFAVHKLMTAPEEFYWAYYAEEGDTFYETYDYDNRLNESKTNPYKFYRRSETEGLITDYKAAHANWVLTIANKACCSYSADRYKGDDQDLIDWNEGSATDADGEKISSGLPGIGDNDPLKSIEWHRTHTWNNYDVQDVLFIMTQQRSYSDPHNIPQAAGEMISQTNIIDPSESNRPTDTELKAATFTTREKQNAIWRLNDRSRRLNIGLGVTEEQAENNDSFSDRKLGYIADSYQTFYNLIHGENDLNNAYNSTHTGDDIYGDKYVQAMWVDDTKDNQVYYEGENTTSGIEHVKRIAPVTIDGETINEAYEYKDTDVLVNTADNTMVLGPFAIDYTVDDATLDTYAIENPEYNKDHAECEPHSEKPSVYDQNGNLIGGYKTEFDANGDPLCKEPWYISGIRFDEVFNIEVYNQNKVNIESLGAYFKIAYEVPNVGGIEDAKEGQIIYYNEDNPFNPMTLQETNTFRSRKPFYIVVHRQNMKIEDFTGFYAKITFNYLENIEGSVHKYEGYVVDYYYTKTEIKCRYSYDASWTFNHSPLLDKDISDGSETKVFEVPTYVYELHREYSGELAQQHIGYSHDGIRNYKYYSIVITANITQKDDIDIEVIKKCADCQELLYGAEFEITAEVNGYDETLGTIRNIHKFLSLGNKVTGKGNKKGTFHIKDEDFESATLIVGKNTTNVCPGFSIKNFTGDVIITFKEASAPAGHVLDKTNHELRLKLENGLIQPPVLITGATDQISYTGGQSAKFTIMNKEGGTPKIQLEKVEKTVDKNGVLLDNIVASFEIQVAYTDPNDSSKLIDKKSNVIRGQTKKGILTLTREDFQDMKKGFDIQSYTGKIKLSILEVQAYSKTTGTEYTVTPRNRRITLKYKDGILQEYKEYTDAKVTANQVYSNPMSEIYRYIETGNASYVSDETMDYLQDWIRDQIRRSGTTESGAYTEAMSYDDVLGWLEDYIEEKAKAGEIDLSKRLEEWTTSTMTVESINRRSGDIVRITIEDIPTDRVIELPDIPKKTDEYLTMKIAGTAFLDEVINKQSANEADGMLNKDEGDNETLLSGIKVTLYESNGQRATLVQKQDRNGKYESRTNPTMTDENGYYEFNGVDPAKDYYVEFAYNGMEYRVTQEDTSGAKYNSADWAKTSKAGSEDQSKLDDYQIIKANTHAYDYSEIAGIYEEITRYVLNEIRTNNRYPGYSTTNVYDEAREKQEIHDYILDLHKNETAETKQDIEYKLTYIFNCQSKAYAGYSSPYGQKSETYPHKDVKAINGNRYVITLSSINNLNYNGTNLPTVKFAGEEIPAIYNGQLNVNLGLIERPDADLSLKTDIVDTKVSMNNYDTTYEYNKSYGAYHQYMYEEDYNYSTTETEDGIAYYTDDNVHFYITYEIGVENTKNQKAILKEIVNYYNREFKFDSNGYTTTKGTYIPAITSYWGNNAPSANNLTNDLGVYVTPTSSYAPADGEAGMPDYNKLYINCNDKEIQKGNDAKIRITFELVGNADNAKEVLSKYLLQTEARDGNSKSWEIDNFSEINAYSAESSDGKPTLDTDSKPGTFSIQKYKVASSKYSDAMVKYYTMKKQGANDTALETQSRIVNAYYNEILDIREDDTAFVKITLTNHGKVRELSGNVWEAVDDTVKSSLDLQSEYGDRYVTYSENQNLEGIKVELVELEKDGKQTVRAVTTTGQDGNYKFKSFIAGDYVVRFVYGGADSTVTSKVSKNTYDPEREADYLPINGQYYQSTKANPETNTKQYWYANRGDAGARTDINVNDLVTPGENVRYSDAYDDAYTRRTQMLSNITEGGSGVIENRTQTSSSYDYQGVISVESLAHNDPIYAYTSTMELEVEYIRPDTKGNKQNNWYKYEVHNVDFGVTPRSYNDVNLSSYVQNVTLVNQTGETLIDIDFDENGDKIIEEGQDLDNIIRVLKGAVLNYPDGQIDAQYDTELLMGSTISITYSMKVANDSLHDGNIYDQITYIYKDGKVIAVKYYNEELGKMVYYEKDSLRNNDTIVYHNNSAGSEYSNTCLSGEDRKHVNDSNHGRLQYYTLITGYNEGNREVITSKVTNIVDFVNQPLGFTNDGTIEWNKHWSAEDKNNEAYERTDYISSRENYNLKDGEITYKGISEGDIIQNAYTRSIRYGYEGEDGLYARLQPGESRTDKLTLTLKISSSTAESNSYEYPNMVEITDLSNSAGKIVDIEGYSIDGKETSSVTHLRDIQYGGFGGTLTPTISNSKPATVTINVRAGLTFEENIIESNLMIILVALVVLAVGLILIKKFVITPKKEE